MSKRLTVKINMPFLHNGKMLKAGDEIEMDFNRACRHMKVGDVERDENAIKEFKEAMKAKAESDLKAAGADW